MAFYLKIKLIVKLWLSFCERAPSTPFPFSIVQKLMKNWSALLFFSRQHVFECAGGPVPPGHPRVLAVHFNDPRLLLREGHTCTSLQLKKRSWCGGCALEVRHMDWRLEVLEGKE